MRNFWTLAFWRDAAERLIFTAAETLLAILTANGAGITDLATGETWSLVGLATLAALLKVIIAALGGGNPSAFNGVAPAAAVDMQAIGARVIEGDMVLQPKREVPPVGATEQQLTDSEGLPFDPDETPEVDDTPPGDGYVPRHLAE